MEKCKFWGSFIPFLYRKSDFHLYYQEMVQFFASPSIANCEQGAKGSFSKVSMDSIGNCKFWKGLCFMFSLKLTSST